MCKDENARINIQYTLHEEWAKQPPVHVLDEWPDEWKHVNAVVMMPILVLGTEKATSFSITGDVEVDEVTREVLNAYINLIRTSGVPPVSYRDVCRATGLDRRTVSAALRKLTNAGIGTYKYGVGFKLDIARWVLDAERARALGIKIEEYKV